MSFLKSIAVAAAVIAAPIAAQDDSVLQEILNTGVLKVGTTGDWNPITMKDVTSNSYTGYDIDVMTQLAADLGVTVEFVPADWRTLVAGISAGTYHMTGSASVTPAKSSPPAADGRVMTRRTRCSRGRASCRPTITLSLPTPEGPTTAIRRPWVMRPIRG